MMLLLAGVDCSVNKAKFTLEPSLANKVCSVDSRVFEQKAVSPIFCLAIASLTADYVGVSYDEEQQMCYGCNTSCDLEEFQPKLGSSSVFYSRPKACPGCFEDIAGYLLMVVTDQSRTYDQANCACAERSASLVRIDSRVKQAAIMDHLNGLSTGGIRYWIQCRKDISDGEWKFDDGPIRKLIWTPGWPKIDRRNCGYVIKGSNYWMNLKCDTLMGLICEI